VILPELVRTTRLTLRRPRLSDAQAVFEEYASDPEVTRYMDWPTHRSVRDAEAFLPLCDTGWASGRDLSWAITLTPSDRVIGMIGLRPHGFKADFGYVLTRRLWGQGIMPEAAGAIVGLAFEDPSVRRVWATCDVENRASVRVLEKLGLTYEGTMRRHLIRPNLSAEPRDSLVYARVR
jgi:ribosomal-protein-alanine N-acetyltransferase